MTKIFLDIFVSIVGAAAIAATLKESNNFSFVSLEWNQIECDGAAHLAEALTLNTNLTHLDLRNNNISDDGAFALGKALTSNDTLKTLDLRWNQVRLISCFLKKYFFLFSFLVCALLKKKMVRRDDISSPLKYQKMVVRRR